MPSSFYSMLVIAMSGRFFYVNFSSLVWAVFIGVHILFCTVVTCFRSEKFARVSPLALKIKCLFVQEARRASSKDSFLGVLHVFDGVKALCGLREEMYGMVFWSCLTSTFSRVS